MTAGRKKVIVRCLPHGVLRGYLPTLGFVRQQDNTPFLDLLDLEGRVQSLPLADVKLVSFVRDFYAGDDGNPERLPRKTFQGRPRTEGLWVRLTLRDDDLLEGLASLDTALADGFVDDLGLQMVPPDVRGNTLRLYVPRSAMLALQVVAVVTTPSRRRMLEAPRPAAGQHGTQMDLALQASGAAADGDER